MSSGSSKIFEDHEYTNTDTGDNDHTYNDLKAGKYVMVVYTPSKETGWKVKDEYSTIAFNSSQPLTIDENPSFNSVFRKQQCVKIREFISDIIDSTE